MESRFPGIPTDELALWYGVMRQAITDLTVTVNRINKKDLRDFPPEDFFMDGLFEPICTLLGFRPSKLVALLTITGLLEEAPDGYTRATREKNIELAKSIEGYRRMRELEQARRDADRSRKATNVGKAETDVAGMREAA